MRGSRSDVALGRRPFRRRPRPARWPWRASVLLAAGIAIPVLAVFALGGRLSESAPALAGIGATLISFAMVFIRFMQPLPVGATALDPAILHGTYQLPPPREGRGLRIARMLAGAGLLLLISAVPPWLLL